MRNLADLLTFVIGPRREQKDELPVEIESCLVCGESLRDAETYRRYRVCPGCRFHYSLPARQRIELLADPGSFKESNRSLVSLDPLSFSSRVPYRSRFFEDQKRTGLTDAIVTGTCRIGGRQTVIAVLDFGFLGGSMGCVVGEKMSLAFEMAAKKKLPLISLVASGGARLQEGVLSLMQMAKAAAAAQRLHDARLPFISVMANPTTGGVYASFANLADIIIAEPKARLGFASLRAVEQATGKPLPEGAHTAEWHLEHGLIDHVADRTKLRDLLSALLDLLGPRYKLSLAKEGRQFAVQEQTRPSAWQTVQIARHPQRPTARDFISRMTSGFVELHGDRQFADDPAIICGIADLSGQAVVVIGQEQGPDGQARLVYPEGFRKAQRAMRLAAKFGLPILTLIDTPGAYQGLEAEDRGIGHAIATSMALMSELPVPIISVVIGEGGSEGALALSVADRILMLEHAILSVISPEGAASLLYRDSGRAEEVAPALKLTATDCKDLRVIDGIVPEPEGGAHIDPQETSRLLMSAILRELIALQNVSPARLVRTRYKKFRRMGEYNSFFEAAVSREVKQLQDYLAHRMEGLREHIPGRAERQDAEKESGDSPLIP